MGANGFQLTLLLTTGLLVAALPWIVGGGGAVEAHHYHTSGYGGDDRLHNAYIHYASSGHSWADEDLCVWSDSQSTLSNSTLAGYMLALTGGNSPVWDLTGWENSTNGYKLDIYLTANHCEYYAPNYIGIEVFAWSFINNSSYCWGETNISCVRFGDERWVGGTLEDYWDAYIFFKTSHLTGGASARRAVINHEFGHVVGLMDPNPGGCSSPFTPTIVSVMHQYTVYGCTQEREWPFSNDKASVAQNVMPWPHITD
jgi:hypothetical protein